jgi:hypothetical protein
MANGAPPPTFDEFEPRANVPATRKEQAQTAGIRSTEARTEASRATAKRTEALMPFEVATAEAKAGKAQIDREAARIKLDKARQKVGAMPKPEKLDEARRLVMDELKNALEAKKLSREMSGASGFAFDLTSGISGSPGASVKSLLEPIYANTAFNRLQKMRAESPTGGALGAVSDKELSLLKSSEAAIDPSASDKVFQSGLDTVIGNRIETLMKLGADPLELAQIIPPEDLPVYKDRFRAYRFLEDDVAAMNNYMQTSRKAGTYDPADFAELMGQAYFNATGREPNQEFFESAFDTGIKYLENPEATLSAFDYSQADEDIQKRIGSSAYTGDDGLTWGETLGGAAINFVPSTFELAFDTVKALTVDLPDTIEGVADIVGGATGLSDDPSAWEALKTYYSDRYGSVEGFKKALRTDPASIAADVAGLLTGGATIVAKAGSTAAKVSKINALSNAAKASESFANFAGKIDPLSSAASIAKKGLQAGAATAEAVGVGLPARYAGTTGEAVKQAFEAGKRKSPEFAEQISGAGDVAAPVAKAEAALTELYQDRSNRYTQRMARLKKDEVVSFDDVDQAIAKVAQVGQHKGIDISSAADVWDEVSAKIDEFRAKDLNTIEDFDAMKRAVRTIASKYQLGTPQHKVAKDVSKAINDVIVDKAPVYANIMKEYRDASDVLADVKASLSIDAKSADTTLGKLRRTVEGRGPRGRTVLDILEQTPSGKGLGDMLAGQALSSPEVSGFGATVTGAGAAATGSPEMLAMATMSPRSLGTKAYEMGQVYGPVERAVQGLGQTPVAQKAVDLMQRYGQPAAEGVRMINPIIQSQVDPMSAGAQSVPLSEAAMRDYMPPFPTVEMSKPGALTLEQFYAKEDPAVLSLEAFRSQEPLAGQPVAEEPLPEEEEEETQQFARGGLAVAPIALRKGGQPKKQGYDYANAARTFGQGLSFGFGDEIEARLRTLAAKDPNAYRNEVNRIRMLQERYAERNPNTAMALEGAGMVGGSLLAPSLGGARALANAPRAARIGANLIDDVGQGLFYTAGKAETNRAIPAAIQEEGPRAIADFAILTGAGAAGKRLAKTKPGQAAINLAARPVRYAVQRVRGR